MIDQKRRSTDEVAIGRFQTTQQNPTISGAVAEGEVNSLETAGTITVAGTMQIPATEFALNGMTVTERVWMVGGVIINFDLDKTIRFTNNEKSNAVEKSVGERSEPVGNGLKRRASEVGLYVGHDVGPLAASLLNAKPQAE